MPAAVINQTGEESTRPDPARRVSNDLFKNSCNPDRCLCLLPKDFIMNLNRFQRHSLRRTILNTPAHFYAAIRKTAWFGIRILMRLPALLDHRISHSDQMKAI
jgi:hypothetical protein